MDDALAGRVLNPDLGEETRGVRKVRRLGVRVRLGVRGGEEKGVDDIGILRNDLFVGVDGGFILLVAEAGDAEAGFTVVGPHLFVLLVLQVVIM